MLIFVMINFIIGLLLIILNFKNFRHPLSFYGCGIVGSVSAAILAIEGLIVSPSQSFEIHSLLFFLAGLELIFGFICSSISFIFKTEHPAIIIYLPDIAVVLIIISLLIMGLLSTTFDQDNLLLIDMIFPELVFIGGLILKLHISKIYKK